MIGFESDEEILQKLRQRLSSGPSALHLRTRTTRPLEALGTSHFQVLRQPEHCPLLVSKGIVYEAGKSDTPLVAHRRHSFRFSPGKALAIAVVGISEVPACLPGIPLRRHHSGASK
jgi:hypothetical protein